MFAFGRDKPPTRREMPASVARSIEVAAEPATANYAVQFAKCGRVRTTCVVDGDTFWLNGQKIRIADIDTPEISKPQCSEELALGLRATDRLIVLLNEGTFALAISEWGDEDRYGRKLRLIVRQGASIGDRLVQEGLAHRWNGHKIPWC